MESKKTFLIIDDNLIDQLVVSKLIKRTFNNAEINIVNNGKEGIDWLNNRQDFHEPLIIFLDIQMPIMNGFQFLNEFQKMNLFVKKQTRIYIHSSTLDPEEIEKINKNNLVTELIKKPLLIEELQRKFIKNSAV